MLLVPLPSATDSGAALSTPCLPLAPRAPIVVLRRPPDLLLTDTRISCSPAARELVWSASKDLSLLRMVDLEPRRHHTGHAHSHTELYVVYGVCGLCLLFLALAFIDTRKRMSVRKRLLGEKLA